ncbi:MAG: hypothetical protein QF910_01915, partial [Myxococcota bacterium]|nr:hypothetical protein [Myxococcota bacterium]
MAKLTVFFTVLLIALAGTAAAETPNENPDELGDGIDERLDRRGDRIDERLDRRGDRIDERLDRRGDRI